MPDRLDRLLARRDVVSRIRDLEKATRGLATVSAVGVVLPEVPTGLAYSLSLETLDNVQWAKADLSWYAANVSEWVVGYQKVGENDSHAYTTRENEFDLRHLVTGAQYYMWVYSVSGDGYPSASAYFNSGSAITMPYPGIPTTPVGLTTNFDGLGLVCQWLPVEDRDLRDYVLMIYDGPSRNQCLKVTYEDATHFEWGFDENVRAAAVYGLSAQPALQVDLYARNWGGGLSSVASSYVTNAVPTTPSAPTIQSSFESVLAYGDPVADEDVDYYEWEIDEQVDGGGWGTAATIKGGLNISYGGAL